MTEPQLPADLVPTLAPGLLGTESALRDAVRDGLPAAFADLSRLVRIPSVSWTGFDRSHVRATADAVAALFEATGVFDRVEVAQAPIPGGDLGNPAVLARREARNGRPTVLLYAHHDVQPPGDETLWLSPPYEPTVRGDRLYGRGAADDKAGVISHVATIRALVDVLGTDLDLGIAVFIEGEEEFGSRSFPAFLEAHRDALAADAIVVADSGNWDVATPALSVSLRGNVTFTLTVATLDHALHSGMFGGAVPDALLAFTRLVATLHREDGSVAVEGLTSRAGGDGPPYDEARLREESGLLDGVTPLSTGSITSRIWDQPAITVTGIDVPSVQNASNTLQPTIRARISVRIAPGQRAADAYAVLEHHIRAHVPFGARVEFTDVDLGDPFEVDTSGAMAAEALRAMADAWGAEPVRMGVGGSIPFIADLVRVYPDAAILVTGVEDPDSRAHSPNESLHLPSFHRAVLAQALLLLRLSGTA